MGIEQRWIVSLDEIRAIRWECRHCRVATSYPLDHNIQLPEQCPACGARGLDRVVMGFDHQAYDLFIRTLKSILETQQPEHPMAPGGMLSLELVPDDERSAAIE